jgi:regulation of enolase protein 1 (concanavalin A-like superfamily)
MISKCASPIIAILVIVFLLSCSNETAIYESSGEMHSLNTLIPKNNRVMPPWQCIRTNINLITSGTNSIVLQLAEGSLMGEGKGVENLFLRSIPPEFTEVSLKFEFEPQKQYEQAGLLLYVDDDNYIKFVKEFIDGQPWFVMVVELKGKTSYLEKAPYIDSFQKIEMTFSENFEDDQVRCQIVDKDGTKVPVGFYTFKTSVKPRIGFFTQNGNKDDPRYAEFFELWLFKPPEKNE